MERAVIQFDSEGNQIDCFESIRCATEYLDISRSSVRNRCEGKTKTPPFLKWYYDIPYEERTNIKPKRREIYSNIGKELDALDVKFNQKILNILKQKL